jgi:phosphoglycolate phosphatase-like HAD superfamily hydrolase
MLQFAQEVCDELRVNHIVEQNDLRNLEVMSFAMYGRACEVPEYLVDEFVRRCLNRFAGKKSPPNIFKGMDEVIRKLSENNIIAIVTGNNADTVNAFLVEHGLDDGQIRAIYGVDSPGSKAEKISLARSQFAKNGESVIMVGDTLSDASAAKEASVKSISVSWGHQNAEMLIRAESDYFVDSPRELFEAITKGENRSGS